MSQTLILTRPRTSNPLRSVSTAKTEGLLRDIAFVLHISDRLAGEIRKSRPTTSAALLITGPTSTPYPVKPTAAHRPPARPFARAVR